MNEQILNELQKAYTEYLSTLSIGTLRSVGRQIGVNKSTAKKKGELVDEMVAVLSGVVPPAERTNRGAPVKDEYVDPKVFEKLEEIKFSYLSSMPAEQTGEETSDTSETVSEENTLEVRTPEFSEKPKYYESEVYSGQLATVKGVSQLLPTDNQDVSAERIIVTVAQIKELDLREGDIVSCHAERHHAALIATDILSVNGLAVEKTSRPQFEKCDVAYPTERISFCGKGSNSVVMKYLDWIVPVGKGQRTLIASTPRVEKTAFLKKLVKALTEERPDIRLLVLLTDQSPEEIGELKQAVPQADFLGTTFDDDAKAHIFAAEFLLNRAKRFAETGMDVFLIIDSLTNLAHIYNDLVPATEGKLLSGGLQSTTVHFMRRYFGSARCLVGGGSLSTFGMLSVDTGNPMDDILAGELVGMTNAEILLTEDVSSEGLPLIDAVNSQTRRSEFLLSSEDYEKLTELRRRYLPLIEDDFFSELMEKASTFEELYLSVVKAVEGE